MGKNDRVGGSACITASPQHHKQKERKPHLLFLKKALAGRVIGHKFTCNRVLNCQDPRIKGKGEHISYLRLRVPETSTKRGGRLGSNNQHLRSLGECFRSLEGKPGGLREQKRIP